MFLALFQNLVELGQSFTLPYYCIVLLLNLFVDCQQRALSLLDLGPLGADHVVDFAKFFLLLALLHLLHLQSLLLHFVHALYALVVFLELGQLPLAIFQLVLIRHDFALIVFAIEVLAHLGDLLPQLCSLLLILEYFLSAWI